MKMYIHCIHEGFDTELQSNKYEQIKAQMKCQRGMILVW